MEKSYQLRDAITFNPSGKVYNANATIATTKEIKAHKDYFGFKFENTLKNGNTVYKITKENDEDVIQGLVAAKQADKFLDCANMEINKINKKPLLLHAGIGKAMIALCCKISFDLGNDGFVTFEAKSKLKNYYARFGAKPITGLKMYLDSNAAKKLVDIYF